MKRRLLSMATGIVAGFCVFTASGQSAVISQDFEGTEFPPQGWVTADVDGDGHCWQSCEGSQYVSQKGSSKKLAVSFTRDPGSYTAYGAQDNWLISPAFEVKSNALVLKFDYAAQDLESVEPIEVLLSEGGSDVADFTKVLWSTSIDNGYADDVSIEEKTIPLTDYKGKTIRVAFRHKANASYGLSIDNVFVNDQNGPNILKWYGATPGANGEKSVTLKWLNPTTTANGDPLTDLSVNVYRDGEKIATVTENVVPGGDTEWTDRTVTSGTHTYNIEPVANGLTGKLSSGKTVYVGEDVPAAVRDPFAMASGNDVVLTWTAPTQGVNKGYINADNLKYVITRSAGGVETSMDCTGKTTFTDADVPQGVQLVYKVKATNEAGESPVEDHTSAIVYGDKAGEFVVGQTNVRNNALTRLPVDLSSKYSVSQTIYFPDELMYASGDITSLVYKVFRGVNSTLSVPVQVYMSETDQAAFAGEWIDMTGATLVFDGNLTTDQGARDVVIKLDTPYSYTGKNLVVTFIKTDNPQGSYSDRFYSVETARANRSFTTNTYNPIDITALPHSTYGDKSVGDVPYTRFVVSVKNSGSVNGVVTDSSTGAAVAGAKVSVAGFDAMTAVTDGEGKYRFAYVPAGKQTVTVEANGYATVSNEVTVTDGAEVVNNVAVVRLANYVLSGTVKAGDTGLAAAGAVVALDGYEAVSTTADEKGSWSIEGVYSGKDYTLTVKYPLYDVYTAAVNNESADRVDAGEIMLERSLIPAYAVKAEVSADGAEVALTWKDPASRDGEPGWKSQGDVTEQSSTSGDYYATDYSVGHAFTSAELAEQKMTGLSVTALRVYLKASEGTFTAKVWEGTRDANKAIASKQIPAEAVSADGAWATVEFAEPVELVDGKNYIFGVQCVGASSSPVGTAPSAQYKSGKNNIKWSDAEYSSNGYYAWCVEALCEVPASPAGVVENAEAPKCSYNVYRSAASNPSVWEKVTASPVNETSYTDAGWGSLLSDEYTYAVTAVYQSGESMKAYADPISRSNDYDAAVVAFVSPVKSVDIQSDVDVVVRVVNFGEKPVSDFPVSVTLDGGNAISTTVTATLNKGESTEVKVGALTLTEGVHTIVASTGLEGDEVMANNACTLTIPNVKNVELTGYRWDAYGNAGFMRVQSNNPEGARYLREVTPNDALIIAGECVNGKLYAFTATWYGLSKEFVEIDPVTWAVTRNVENSEDYVLDMAYDYANGVMYALAPVEEAVYLATVDLETGKLSYLADPGIVIRTLACDLKGKLYGVADNGNFYSIDSTTAVPTLIGDTGAGKIAYLQSMAFDHNTGRLFWAATSDHANGDIYEIDPATGAASKYGSTLFNGIDPSELVALFTPYQHEVGGVDSAVADGAVGLTVDASGKAVATVASDAVVTVYDMNGVAVVTRNVEAGTTEMSLDLQSGVYAATLVAADGAELTVKFVIR